MNPTFSLCWKLFKKFKAISRTQNFVLGFLTFGKLDTLVVIFYYEPNTLLCYFVVMADRRKLQGKNKSHEKKSEYSMCLVDQYNVVYLFRALVVLINYNAAKFILNNVFVEVFIVDFILVNDLIHSAFPLQN